MKCIFSIFIILTLTATFGVTQTLSAQSNQSLYVTDIQWSPDGLMVAVVGIIPYGDTADGYVAVHNTLSNEIIVHNQIENTGFTSVSWHPEGTLIAVGSYDQTVKIFDVASGVLTNVLTGHHATVTSVDWNPDATLLVSTGTLDQQVIVWDINTGLPRHTITIGDPWTAAFSPDGNQIAVGGIAGLHIFPIQELDSESITARRFEQFRLSDRYIGELAWIASGDRIALGTQTFPSAINPQMSPNANLIIVETTTGNVLNTIEAGTASIFGVTISPDAKMVVTHDTEGILQIWSLIDETLVDSYFTGIERYGSTPSFSPFGGRLASPSIVQEANVLQGQNLAEAGIRIIVPDASRERLQAIQNACGLDTTRVPELQSAQSADLNTYTEQIQALPAETIPPACAADLIAVAEAIQAQE